MTKSAEAFTLPPGPRRGRPRVDWIVAAARQVALAHASREGLDFAIDELVAAVTSYAASERNKASLRSRLANSTREQRAEWARHAAKSRWANKAKTDTT